MRRLDLRPADSGQNEPLRNPGRHLRALARWAENIERQLPEPDVLIGERFFNLRVGVHSRLVEPPHATDAARRACLSALFEAARRLEASPRRLRPSRVAVLAVTPWLFSSEVTLFFDEAYFTTFLPPAKASRTHWDGGWVECAPASPADVGDLLGLAPDPPPGLAFAGGYRMTEWNAEEPHEPPASRLHGVWTYPPAPA